MSANNMQTKPNKFAPAMPEDLYRDAVNLFNIQSTTYNEKSITIYICKFLDKNKIKYSIDGYGNILITKGKGNLYPCFGAHLDTVHIYENGFNVYFYNKDNRKYLLAKDNNKKSVGIGGDDKCGIFVCLYLLQKIDNIKIVFFSQEESGGIGSSNIDLDFFSDCKFLSSVDRWNGHDFINQYNGQSSISKQFKKAISGLLVKYDYSFNSGLFTDCFNVWTRGLKLSCFNLSCGYYCHHSKDEHVDLNELYNCCLLCEELAILPDQYKHEYKRAKITTAHNWSGDKFNKWEDRGFHYWDDCRDVRYCKYCGIELLSYEIDICDLCKDEMKELNINDKEIDNFIFS